MKPHNKNRSRAYYRHHRKRVIQRKAKIAKRLGWYTRDTGYFAKGKIHCSCWLCTQKTNRNGFPQSQIVQLESMNCQLSDFLNESLY